MALRFKNTSKRSIPLGGVVSVRPGSDFDVSNDARAVVKRPVFEAYVYDGTFVGVNDAAKTVCEDIKKKVKKMHNDAKVKTRQKMTTAAPVQSAPKGKQALTTDGKAGDGKST